MKKYLILLIAGVTFAFGYGLSDDNGSEYESTMGNRYKYDLSNPVDKLNYSTDTKAQMNDMLYKPITPSVKIDESLGEYGGGLKSPYGLEWCSIKIKV